MNQQHFDKHIREQLEHLSPTMDIGSWDLFVKKLDANEVSIPNQETTFDNIFRDKLSDLSSVTTSAGTWDLFEQKLDIEEAGTPVFADQHLDEVVYTKMHAYRVPYDATTWTTLLHRLRREEAHRWKIAAYKSLELAIIALCLLWGSQILSPTQTPNSTQPTVVNPQAITPVINESTETALIDARPQTKQKTNTNTSLKTSVDKPTTSTLKGKNSKLAVVNSGTDAETTPIITKIEGSSQIPPIDAAKFSGILDPLPNIQLPDEVYSLTTQPFISEAKANASNSATLSTQEITENFDFLVTKSGALSTDKDFPLLEKVNITASSGNKFRVGMFGSSVFDHIYTPYDRILLQDAYDRYSNGYGGGFSISKQLSRWEIETGLMYIAKSYKQKAIIHIFNGSVKDGYDASYVTDIELNIVNIPLNVRYNILHNNKWKMYGLTGGSLQLILQSNYDANLESLGAAPPDVRNNGTKESSGKSFYNRKKFPNGFLVDKNFRDNRFYTLNIGLGLERFITPRWSIFAQPTYQQTIQVLDKNGIGPNQDRINSMLILMGAKVGL